MALMGGSIGRYHDQLGGGAGASAAKKAMRQRVRGIDEARGIYEERTPQLMEYYEPYVAPGDQAYQMYQSGMTPEGYAENIERIQQSSAYEALLAPRREEAQRQLASAGLSRSSAGARRAADVSMDTITGLEGLLSGRQRDVAGMGMGARQSQAGLQQGLMDTLANMALQRAEAKAGGTLAAQQARAQGEANRYQAMHNVGSSVMGMFGAGMGGGGDGSLNVQSGNQGALDTSYQATNPELYQYDLGGQANIRY